MDSESEHKQNTDDENHEEGEELGVIPLQLIKIHRNTPPPSFSNQSAVRSRYYKQTYRPAWEQMPDFKGWLRGVEGEPTRAYCTYCEKTLHAHRLSLLKHTCTIRHQKAAQSHSTRKNKAGQRQRMESDEVETVFMNEVSMLQEESEDGETQFIEYSDGDIGLEQDDQHEPNDEDEDENEVDSSQFKETSTFQKQDSSATDKTPISTHVVDTTRGSPVVGLSVSLYKLIEGRWTYINEGLTNTQGRVGQFISRADFSTGRYKLHYDVDRLFSIAAPTAIATTFLCC
ncbi:uncharacterized protein LOC132698046 isoform X2 [Cylas formicarius]|uniref:uncharacterized protein LOC132698046 isoform X2 n=1 Tax=Cylas formicarius TaxID=197179 RepID=UPI002958D4D8|nr:uncharacterized protein LOC132698046 isoform X2 [Cylas formicarius]